MSLSREQVLRLMAYADGELEDGERASVESLLAASAEARCVVAAMEGSAIGEWVVRSQDERAARGGADGIADAVIAKIQAPAAVDIAAARRRQEERQRASRRTGAIAVGFLALAAGVALYVASNRSGGSVVPSMPVAANPPATSALSTAATAAQPAIAPSAALPENAVARESPPVEIESDSDDVSVYYVPTSPGAAANVNATSVVIWFDDTAVKKP